MAALVHAQDLVVPGAGRGDGVEALHGLPHQGCLGEGEVRSGSPVDSVEGELPPVAPEVAEVAPDRGTPGEAQRTIPLVDAGNVPHLRRGVTRVQGGPAYVSHRGEEVLKGDPLVGPLKGPIGKVVPRKEAYHGGAGSMEPHHLGENRVGIGLRGQRSPVHRGDHFGVILQGRPRPSSRGHSL